MIFVIAGCQLGTKVGTREDRIPIEDVLSSSWPKGLSWRNFLHYWQIVLPMVPPLMVPLWVDRTELDKNHSTKLIANISGWFGFQAPAFSSLDSLNDGLQPVRWNTHFPIKLFLIRAIYHRNRKANENVNSYQGSRVLLWHTWPCC